MKTSAPHWPQIDHIKDTQREKKKLSLSLVSVVQGNCKKLLIDVGEKQLQIIAVAFVKVPTKGVIMTISPFVFPPLKHPSLRQNLSNKH